MSYRTLLLTAALTLTLAGACTQDEATACGQGNVYRDGDCHPASSTTAGTASEAGAAPAAGGANDAGASNNGGAIDAAFGQPCTTSNDCMAPTNYCVPMSPFDTAYCSVSGCDVDPSICPSGWTCFDVGQFVQGGPQACTRPFP